MGLKPITIVKQICPVQGCDYEFTYHYKDRRTHPDTWILTASSIAHLAEAHVAKPKLYIVQSEELPAAA